MGGPSKVQGVGKKFKKLISRGKVFLGTKECVTLIFLKAYQ